MEIKPTGLAWNLPPSQRPFRPVPAISPTPVSVLLPFIVIAHGAVGDGNLRDRNGNQGRGNANQGPSITNQGRKTEREG